MRFDQPTAVGANASATTTVARSASWLRVTHASRVATSVSVSRAAFRQGGIPTAVLELT